MFEFATTPFLNHLLKAAPWALAALKPHAGKNVRFRIGLTASTFTIDASGELRPAPSDAVADVELSLTSAALARAVIERDRAAFREAQVSGDSALAAEIARIAQHLSWDVEEDLSRFMGDVLAHRVVGTAKTIDAWQHQALHNLGHSFKEYWTEEKPLITGRERIEDFARQVESLRDDVERLEKRIEKIAQPASRQER
jgi:ubiquinone biosynthesis accessory factor UbiJ